MAVGLGKTETSVNTPALFPWALTTAWEFHFHRFLLLSHGGSSEKSDSPFIPYLCDSDIFAACKWLGVVTIIQSRVQRPDRPLV